MFPFLDILSPVINKVLDFIPDPQKKAEAQAAALKAAQDHETDILKLLQASDAAQASINERDAESEDKFKSYWRPAFGWVCVLGFSWSSIIQPIVVCIYTFKTGHQPILPVFDTALLTSMTTGLLGLGAYRSWDKKNGVA